MRFENKKLIFGSMLIVVIFISLACNIPVQFFNFESDAVGERDENQSMRNFVDDTTATLVSDDGNVIQLPLVHGESWECVDVDGELTYLKNHTDMSETLILRKSTLDLWFQYLLELNNIVVHYKYDHELDTAVLDVNDMIIDWDHSKWFGESVKGVAPLKDYRYFSGSFTVAETRESTYPETVTSTVDEIHNFFGLIDRDNPRLAYYCDLNAIQIPGKLENLTPSNFQDMCQLYYYECTEH